MNVEIGAEAAVFPEKEYIKGITIAVWGALTTHYPLTNISTALLLISNVQYTVTTKSAIDPEKKRENPWITCSF